MIYKNFQKDKKEINNIKEKTVTEKKNIKTSSKIYILEQKLKELTGQKTEITKSKPTRVKENTSKPKHNKKNYNNNNNSNNKRPSSFSNTEQYNKLKKPKLKE
ncbi:hypothetical protein BCR36DRAFT_19741 [Piromyces finnis]|uniref:Uncharacterized protein n=1 Tax=Piromyces finnis TaxID=1754191 RepID=A0A1Y1VDT0_9FUNG|nr:hypothetical protein BCR36DRAFT_19741 [Piromyces finnis]|eukprot:ORX53718.1 hypothetical protein BCR36DRAFT_19741 [Piromyces finnis]